MLSNYFRFPVDGQAQKPISSHQRLVYDDDFSVSGGDISTRQKNAKTLSVAGKDVAFKLNIEKSKENRIDNSFWTSQPLQMMALPFLEPSDSADPSTESHSRIPQASVKLLWVPQVLCFDHAMGPNEFPWNRLHLLTVDGAGLFRETPAALKMAFCQCVIVHS